MKTQLTLLAAAALLAAGCSNPADNVPAAAVGPASASAAVDAAPEGETSEPADSELAENVTADADAEAAPVGGETASASETPAPAAAAVRTLAFGPESSKIEFIGSKVTGSHDGGFKEFTGEFRTEGDRLADDGIEVVIQTDSLWSDSERLTGHLKNEDFFDVEKYPTAEFVSTAVKPADDGWSITGDLTLHGVTKAITFPAQVQVEDEAVHLTSEFSLNRFDFDIAYTGKADDLIRKEVVIKLDVKAQPGEAATGAEE
jgi:polyisoprenoid-binding protein YceI